MNLTQAHRKANLAAWKATPPARIEKPLKHIAERDHTKTVKNGVTSVEYGPAYQAAYIAASQGNGRYVQQVAKLIS